MAAAWSLQRKMAAPPTIPSTSSELALRFFKSARPHVRFGSILVKSREISKRRDFNPSWSLHHPNVREAPICSEKSRVLPENLSVDGCRVALGRTLSLLFSAHFDCWHDVSDHPRFADFAMFKPEAKFEKSPENTNS